MTARASTSLIPAQGTLARALLLEARGRQPHMPSKRSQNNHRTRRPVPAQCDKRRTNQSRKLTAKTRRTRRKMQVSPQRTQRTQRKTKIKFNLNFDLPLCPLCPLARRSRAGGETAFFVFFASFASSR